MGEIKVGEYVRTCDGDIFRIAGKQRYKDLIIYTTNTFCKYTEIVMNEIVKIHSKKQKDLICEGDIVLCSINNCEPQMEQIIKWKYTQIPQDTETELLGTRTGFALDQVVIFKILTKEQFQQNCWNMEV